MTTKETPSKFKVEKFSKEASMVMVSAKQLAGNSASQFIHDGHILLSLIGDENVRQDLKRKFNTDPDDMKKAAEFAKALGENIKVDWKIPLNDSAKEIVGFAINEARRRGDGEITPSDIFMGFIRQGNELVVTMLEPFKTATETVKLKQKLSPSA